MSDYIDTREGWREVDDLGKARLIEYSADEYGMPVRGWVREEPVPPLPTEEDTAIRPHWLNARPGSRPSKLSLHHGFWMAIGSTEGYAVGDLPDLITGFEVLASPHGEQYIADLEAANERIRRETAKAVLDRLEECVLPDRYAKVSSDQGLGAELRARAAEAKLAKINSLLRREADRPDHWRGQDYMDGRTAVAESLLEILDEQ